MRRLGYFILVLTLLLSACAGPRPEALLGVVKRVGADGKLSTPLAEKDLSAMQLMLRREFPAPPATGWFAKPSGPAGPTTILALEVDLPKGAGNEGDYLTILEMPGGSAELRYYEQSDHRPRTDRFFQRTLTANELAEFNAFIAAHRLADFRATGPVTSPVAPVATIQPAAANVTTEPATQSATQPAIQPEPASETAPGKIDEAATEPAAAEVQFRLTTARPGAGSQDAQMVEFGVLGPEGPAAELLAMLRKMRDAGGFTCTYARSMPLTAKSMYADPYRKVLWVWTGNKDLEIAVTSPLHPMDPPPEGADEHWLAFRNGQWVACAPPGTPATEAATMESATQVPDTQDNPATMPAPDAAQEPPPAVPTTTPTAAQVATWPVKGERTIDPAEGAPAQEHSPSGRLLPQAESWWTQPNVNATVVLHYMPLSSTHGVTHGFVVPGLIFDDEHFAVDASRQVLYLIHDGQLFSLEIPEGAR